VSYFLAHCPLWVSAILIVVLPTIAALFGPIVVRQRVALERLTTNNEIAGFKFGTVGVIYAVLLAFAIIIAWQRYNDAENAVIREAGAAATVYRLAAGDEPEAVQTRAAVLRYLRLAIDEDWPQMAVEKESDNVTRALNTLYMAAWRLAQSGKRQNPILVQMFDQLDVITQARRARLHLAVGIVPGVLWSVLLCGACLTVGFAFFFGTANLRAQVFMTAILAIIVFMGLFVIVAIDYPFTGSVHIHSTPLEQVLQDFGSS
jgi:hypothetical protein